MSVTADTKKKEPPIHQQKRPCGRKGCCLADKSRTSGPNLILSQFWLDVMIISSCWEILWLERWCISVQSLWAERRHSCKWVSDPESDIYLMQFLTQLSGQNTLLANDQF